MSERKMFESFSSPYRTIERESHKIIFISCEGSVTEEEYFNMFSALYPKIQNRIHFVSVKEDILSIPVEKRTEAQNKELRKSSPDQLLKKLLDFRNDPTKKAKYDFDNYDEDEFWIIADIDDHTEGGKLRSWNNTLSQCDSNGCKYAISNPFFEIWLLLHHDDALTDEDDPNSDSHWAVTDSHKYEKTSHFTDRLNDLGFPLSPDQPDLPPKHINPEHYTKEKIKNAIDRAKKLDTPPCTVYPTTLGTTVYKLVKSIVEIDDRYEAN
ncbi:MAG: RloB family protein [Ruminococcus sp.]|nr:RloB family protein [Ruminococcus sp.]